MLASDLRPGCLQRLFDLNFMCCATRIDPADSPCEEWGKTTKTRETVNQKPKVALRSQFHQIMEGGREGGKGNWNSNRSIGNLKALANITEE